MDRTPMGGWSVEQSWESWRSGATQPTLPPEGGQSECARRRSAAGFHLLCSFPKGSDWPSLRGGKGGGGRMTLRWARNCGVRRGLFAGVQDTSFHSLRDGTEAAAEAEPRVTPTLLGFIKIPRINRLLFLIYLHLFSIKESVT